MSGLHSSPGPLEGQNPATSRRILVADDDPGIREILVMLLQQFEHGQDYDVVTAANGHDALQAVMHQRPDLVLLDNDMPGMTGLEVLARIHRIDPDIRVVMVTGRLSPGDAERALKGGAFSYLPKPFDNRYVDTLVAMALPLPPLGR